MRLFFTSICVIILSLSTFAQVQVTESNFFQPGIINRDFYCVENDVEDSVNLDVVITDPFVLGNNLESQFATYDILDSVVFLEPETDGTFSDETCSFADANGMVMHIKVDETTAFCIGVSGIVAQLGIDAPIEVRFDQPLGIAEFPIMEGSVVESSARGEYRDSINVFESMIEQYGTYAEMFYTPLIAKYDSIKVEINVDYLSNFDESGALTLSGTRMMQGNFQYIREKRQYTYTTEVYLREKATNQYININDCSVVVAMLGEVNIGEMLGQYMQMTFPIIQTTTSLNYWTNENISPIVEISTNEIYSAAKALAVRFGNNTVSAEDKNINICVFPNPTTDYLNIATESVENAEVEIFSINGAVVKNYKLNSQFSQINVSDLNAGSYLYKIKSDGTSISGKFVKE